jgi:hypothetical protein
MKDTSRKRSYIIKNIESIGFRNGTKTLSSSTILFYGEEAKITSILCRMKGELYWGTIRTSKNI